MSPTPRNGQSDEKNENQGEGDKKSAERYNDMQKDFVNSEQGRDEIERAGQMNPGEQREAEAAEQEGKSRAKGEDPAVKRKPGGKG